MPKKYSNEQLQALGLQHDPRQIKPVFKASTSYKTLAELIGRTEELEDKAKAHSHMVIKPLSVEQSLVAIGRANLWFAVIPYLDNPNASLLAKVAALYEFALGINGLFYYERGDLEKLAQDNRDKKTKSQDELKNRSPLRKSHPLFDSFASFAIVQNRSALIANYANQISKHLDPIQYSQLIGQDKHWSLLISFPRLLYITGRVIGESGYFKEARELMNLGQAYAKTAMGSLPPATRLPYQGLIKDMAGLMNLLSTGEDVIDRTALIFRLLYSIYQINWPKRFQAVNSPVPSHEVAVSANESANSLFTFNPLDAHLVPDVVFINQFMCLRMTFHNLQSIFNELEPVREALPDWPFLDLGKKLHEVVFRACQDSIATIAFVTQITDPHKKALLISLMIDLFADMDQLLKTFVVLVENEVWLSMSRGILRRFANDLEAEVRGALQMIAGPAANDLSETNGHTTVDTSVATSSSTSSTSSTSSASNTLPESTIQPKKAINLPEILADQKARQAEYEKLNSELKKELEAFKEGVAKQAAREAEEFRIKMQKELAEHKQQMAVLEEEQAVDRLNKQKNLERMEKLYQEKLATAQERANADQAKRDEEHLAELELMQVRSEAEVAHIKGQTSDVTTASKLELVAALEKYARQKEQASLDLEEAERQARSTKESAASVGRFTRQLADSATSVALYFAKDPVAMDAYIARNQRVVDGYDFSETLDGWRDRVSADHQRASNSHVLAQAEFSDDILRVMQELNKYRCIMTGFHVYKSQLREPVTLEEVPRLYIDREHRDIDDALKTRMVLSAGTENCYLLDGKYFVICARWLPDLRTYLIEQSDTSIDCLFTDESKRIFGLPQHLRDLDEPYFRISNLSERLKDDPFLPFRVIANQAQLGKKMHPKDLVTVEKNPRRAYQLGFETWQACIECFFNNDFASPNLESVVRNNLLNHLFPLFPGVDPKETRQYQVTVTSGLDIFWDQQLSTFSRQYDAQPKTATNVDDLRRDYVIKISALMLMLPVLVKMEQMPDRALADIVHRTVIEFYKALSQDMNSEAVNQTRDLFLGEQGLMAKYREVCPVVPPAAPAVAAADTSAQSKGLVNAFNKQKQDSRSSQHTNGVAASSASSRTDANNPNEKTLRSWVQVARR